MNDGSKAATPLIAGTLARFVAGFDGSRLPREVAERTKLLMLDAIGIAYSSTRFAFATRSMAALSTLGGGDAQVIGMAPRLALRDAVLVNGILVHGLDYDDTYLPGSVHLTASCVPTVLGFAAHVGASGAELLHACALGLEMGARLGSAGQGAFLRAGFHATSVVGTFACTLAAGRLMKLDADRLTMAQGIALSMASGNMQPVSDGTWTKRMHPGWSGVSGITAATLAGGGFIAPSAAYEGRFGLFPHFLGEHYPKADLSLATARLGEHWEFPRTSIKLFPACHQSHAFMNAAIKLAKEHGIAPADVESIHTLVAAPAVPLICEPLAEKRTPANSYAAQFSLPYGVACCLARGRFGLEEVEEPAYTDPALLALAQKVTYEVDPNSGFPKFRSGEVIVTMRDGKRYAQRESVVPDEPASAEAIIEKFMQNATTVIPAARAQRIRDAIMSLERQPGARELTAQLGPQ